MPHIHEKIDFCVSAFIVHEGQVLFIFHKKLQKWLAVGGHIELDEDPDQALFREIQEESGLEPDDLEVMSEKLGFTSPGTKFLYNPQHVEIHEIITDTHRHTTLIYYVKAKTDRIKLAEVEHDQIRWFSEQDLEDPAYDLMPSVKFYCREALGQSK
jgi:8-oxo-dGTP pyrophosphatase MutT (NUDIX family)